MAESKNLGNWGRVTPVTGSTHITQTNKNSRAGEGAHITTTVPGIPKDIFVDRIYVDKDGNVK